ncbi:hypothetical protein IW261DRAFT_1416271 [Armillaria novae-zelandiae]|uniref:Apple domain-containing protein n=1 Tax=Armillaria novae-zelandiae TaxID=153914 RepID=A0AA39UKD9_9AGAR|nr:hypothetical protein IW261DRAFT_1416271 [Armillaria novae-zelandiae]
MRFSVAALLPLAVLAVPALSSSGNDGGSKDNTYGNKGKDGGRGDCTWTPVFEHKDDFKGWNKGKYTPYEHKEVTKINFEIECKSFCEKDDKCNSCQAYSHDDKDDKFICELFVEIIDVDTWEQDCDDGKDGKDGKKDDKKYYDTSCWNAKYGN